jgi:hypothetical protein
VAADSRQQASDLVGGDVFPYVDISRLSEHLSDQAVALIAIAAI